MAATFRLFKSESTPPPQIPSTPQFSHAQIFAHRLSFDTPLTRDRAPFREQLRAPRGNPHRMRDATTEPERFDERGTNRREPDQRASNALHPPTPGTPRGCRDI